MFSGRHALAEKSRFEGDLQRPGPLGRCWLLLYDHVVTMGVCIPSWGAVQHRLGPPRGAYWPEKSPFGPVSTMVGKNGLVYILQLCIDLDRNTISLFSSTLTPRTNDRGPRCYLRFPKIGLPRGPHRRALRLAGRHREAFVKGLPYFCSEWL